MCSKSPNTNCSVSVDFAELFNIASSALTMMGTNKPGDIGLDFFRFASFYFVGLRYFLASKGIYIDVSINAGNKPHGGLPSTSKMMN